MDFSAIGELFRRYEEAAVSQDIAPDDEMYQSGKDWYFSVGASALRCILHGLAISRVPQVSSILDLPCGHGRVARHLRAAFPGVPIAFADLSRSAADFCASRFDGIAIYSEPDLSRVTFPTGYDVIWVGSLFTHLDLYRTKIFLQHLVEQLNDNGIVVATFHGRWSVEVQNRYWQLIDNQRWTRILSDYEEIGYGYCPYPGSLPDQLSESPVAQSWGISLVRASRMVELVSGFEGTRLLGYTERGWADNHDVLVLAKTDRLKPW